MDAGNLLSVSASEGLIQALATLFPDRLPRTEMTPFELGVLVGQQRVIDRIRLSLEEAEGDPMVSNGTQPRQE